MICTGFEHTPGHASVCVVCEHARDDHANGECDACERDALRPCDECDATGEVSA